MSHKIFTKRLTRNQAMVSLSSFGVLISLSSPLYAQDAEVNTAPYIENSVNACIGLFNDRFVECFGVPPEGDQTAYNENFCKTEQTQRTLEDLNSNRTCADAIAAFNACMLTVPCDQFSDNINAPFNLSQGNNISANLFCGQEVRFSEEACFGSSFEPIFDNQGNLIEYRVVFSQ